MSARGSNITQMVRWSLPVCPKCKRHIHREHPRSAWYNCPVHGTVTKPLIIEVVEAHAAEGRTP